MTTEDIEVLKAELYKALGVDPVKVPYEQAKAVANALGYAYTEVTGFVMATEKYHDKAAVATYKGDIQHKFPDVKSAILGLAMFWQSSGFFNPSDNLQFKESFYITNAFFEHIKDLLVKVG